MTEYSEIGLRILGEIPTKIWSEIGERLSEDLDVPTDELADEMVAKLNEGQRWAIARATIAVRIDNRRRSIARKREIMATRPKPPAPLSPRFEAPRQRHDERCAELGVPVSTPPAEVTGMNLGILLRRAQDAIYAEAKTKVILDLTSDLLQSEFAVGDGGRATWGTATREQHLTRADSLERTGFGTLETAIRHRIAAEMLSEAGAETLADVARVAA